MTMTYIIQIKPSGYLLFVEEGDTVLGAALKQGYDFPYSCGSATCGTCSGKVISGTYTYDNIEPYALDESAREEGFALFCSVHPTSDMVIELEEVYAPDFLPARKAEYSLIEHNTLGKNIHQLILQPQKRAIQYHAGQYLKIVCDNGVPVPFSVANNPQEDKHIELQIQAVDDNPYVEEILAKINANSDFTLRGAYGNVRYYPELKESIIIVVGGTGIVPMKAMIEHVLSEDSARSIHLYWGGKTVDDLYLLESMKKLALEHKHFTFTPIISGTDEFWQGKTGLVHEIVAHEHDDLSQHQVYASGPTDMVYAAYDAFTQKGLKPQLMFSDTFECFPREN